MRKKKIKPISKTKLKTTIMNLLKRNKKVRILFQNASDAPICSCLCKNCKEEAEQAIYYRRRVIDSRGNCVVSYKSDGHRNFSRYEQSCFMNNYKANELECTCNPDNFWKNCYCEPDPVRYSVKETINLMLDHDDDDFTPLQIEYGKNFSKKKKLI